jgi:DNA-binding NarL/FixJ family response regulator
MPRPRVLLADDHKIVLEGLRTVLANEFDVVGLASNGRELIEQARTLQPDVVVADVSMPLLNGIDAAIRVLENDPRVKIVFLTMHPDPTFASRALAVGASGYVLKHSAPDELVTAITEALRGRTYVSPAVRTDTLDELTDETRRHVKRSLEPTPRQREILQLLAEGKSAKEIGGLLEISPRTVETHKYKMMDDLGVKSSAQLIQYAIKHGLVSI